ncbi:hypothetical protein AB5I39_06360 [Sphingomonas sp. MMS24-J45]|uniref:hypothetical protein n=1 Tax=Sphingomonas sp. MMS24-J45 TaxID=3238806 RepID=UPI00384F64D1
MQPHNPLRQGAFISSQRRGESIGGRLFAFDRRIVLNGARAAFASWQDRLVSALGISVLLAASRAWVADLSWWTAAAVGSAVAIAVGMSVARLIASRLAFHTSDGALAADALQGQARRRYALAWHGIGLMTMAVVTLIVRAPLLGFSLASYVGGPILAGATAAFDPGRHSTRVRNGQRKARTWAQSHRAGILSAAILMLTLLLPGIERGSSAMMAIATVAATLLALSLTGVDDEVVRFLTISGQGPWQIIWRQARSVIVFAVLAAPLLAVCANSALAAIVVAVAAVALLLMSARILAYRLYPRRSADFIISILCAMLLFVAFSMPVLAPVLGVLLIWHLSRRAGPKTWLIA